jgi:superfamily II DNA or RNA helicase
VFSQFTSTLQWLKEELPKHGFQFRTLSGDMSMTKRTKALSDFQNDPPTTVFLLSMRAGAVGINLTQANRIFLMEPCFNPALEAQAVGRVHRLGQKRSVEIIRLLMKNSVDSRIIEMLENKHGKLDFSDAPAKASVGADDEKDSNKDTDSDSVSSSDSDEDEDRIIRLLTKDSVESRKNAADEDKKPAAVDKKAAALDASGEMAVQEVMVGSIYRDKATVVAEELDLLYGVEPTDTVMHQEDEDRGDDLVLDEMRVDAAHDLNYDQESENDWI